MFEQEWQAALRDLLRHEQVNFATMILILPATPRSAAFVASDRHL
jgi:hypothetical protein